MCAIVTARNQCLAAKEVLYVGNATAGIDDDLEAVSLSSGEAEDWDAVPISNSAYATDAEDGADGRMHEPG